MAGKSLTVDGGGIRLDKFLAERFPGYSRAHLKELVLRGCVRVGGEPGKPSRVLEEGESVRIEFPGLAAGAGKDVLKSRVLHEDHEILVLDKPTGLLMHPLGASWLTNPRAALEDTEPNLAGILYSERPGISKAGVPRCGIAHRLDRPTSGVLVVAKTLAAYRSLLGQFKDRAISKVYLALVQGRVLDKELLVDAPVGRAPTGGKITANPFGREASTGLRALAVLKTASWLEARPLTGRTHQIRAHLALAGHPVLGDPEHGGASVPGLSVPRLMLHAFRLEFDHPATGKRAAFRAEIPADFRLCWKALGGRVPPGAAA